MSGDRRRRPPRWFWRWPTAWRYGYDLCKGLGIAPGLAVPDPGAARRPGAAGDRLGLLFAGDGGPVGVTLADAVAILCFIALVGLPCAVFGAAVGAYHTAAPGPTGRRASAAVNGHV